MEKKFISQATIDETREVSERNWEREQERERLEKEKLSKKLWLVYVDYGSYEGHRFVGVFDSEDKAYASIGRASRSRDSMTVKEIELNMPDQEYA